VDGIPFLSFKLEDGVKKEITAYPQGIRGTAHIVLSKSGITISNLSFEHYFSNKNFLFRFFNKYFEFSLYPDKDELHVNFHLKINHISEVIEGKTINSFFKEWIEGDNLQVFTEHWNQALPIPSGSQLKIETVYKQIVLNYRLFFTLFKIQAITRKKIIVPDEISEIEAEIIDELISIIFEESRVKGGQISSSVTLVPGSPINAIFPGFKVSGTKSQNFQLFGTSFCLAIEFIITGIDVELVNYKEISAGISKGETNFDFIAESSKFGFKFLQKLSKDQSICDNQQNAI
jgi:hypothetical protein